jgi:homoserine dehydrogenase
VAERLTAPDPVPHLRLTHICDRRARDKRSRQPDALANLTWTDRFDDLLSADVDIVIDTVSTGEPAGDYIRAALLSGKSVVTANRQVMARQGLPLLTLAERQGRQLRFEAAVGGAMPIVRALGDGLGGDRVIAIDAVLNSTSNQVLSLMEATGGSLDEGIAEACARGFADADPSIDLDGIDAAAKLAILCALGFGVHVMPDAIESRSTAGLRPEDFKKARLRGGTIRQIAHASYDPARLALTAWVAPTFVAADSVFARTEGPQNAAVIACEHGGILTMTGCGAGASVIAAAMIGDLRAIARDRAAIVPAPVLVVPRATIGLSAQTFAEAV